MTTIFHGEIRDGRISLYMRDEFAGLIQKLNGKQIEIVLRRHKEKRSNGQNALYWATYIPAFAEYSGHTPEEMHDAFKMMFLRREGGKFDTVRSTTSLSTDEFTEYLAKIELLAAEHGVFIPRGRDIDH